jgi:hypothetical protein
MLSAVPLVSSPPTIQMSDKEGIGEMKALDPSSPNLGLLLCGLDSCSSAFSLVLSFDVKFSLVVDFSLHVLCFHKINNMYHHQGVSNQFL